MDIRQINEELDRVFKEELQKDKALWNEFEWKVAEYLFNNGITEKIETYTAENGKEIVDNLIEKDIEHEDLVNLYFSCPILWEDLEYNIEELMKEYIAKSLPRCLTIGDKVWDLTKE